MPPKTKTVNVKNGINNQDMSDLNNMFGQMTGAQNADPDIIIPKILNLSDHMDKFYRVYQSLINFKEFSNTFPQYMHWFTDISIFIEKLKLNKITETKDELYAMDVDTLNKKYSELKTCSELQKIIITSSTLGNYKKYISDMSNLKDGFINREPGLDMKVLEFTSLDLKILWGSGKLSNVAKTYILNILCHTYTIGHNIYDIITSPDIDIKKFSRILIASIAKMRKQIPRCDKAFDIIQNSVNMLENKFKDYYKSSVEASNPSIIIENFIVDVSMSQDSSPMVTNQFRRIIMALKRQSQNSNDPRVKKLFGILNNQFNLMENDNKKTDDSFDDKNVPDIDMTKIAKEVFDENPDIMKTTN